MSSSSLVVRQAAGTAGAGPPAHLRRFREAPSAGRAASPVSRDVGPEPGPRLPDVRAPGRDLRPCPATASAT